MIPAIPPSFSFPSSRSGRTRVWIGILAAVPLLAGLGAKPIQPASLSGFAAAGPGATFAPVTGTDTDDVPLGSAQFDTLVIPLPPNAPSLGHEASATSEFGDLIRLSGAAHYIDSVTVSLSSWAVRSDYPGSSPLGFTHPVTLKLYAVDRSGVTPAPGAVLATLTHAFLIPWRPEPDQASTSPLRPWRAADGQYYTGRAFNLTFDLGALGLTLPDEVIFGVSFNTQHQGSAPVGVPGPYDKLGYVVAYAPPSPGTDVESDAVYWQTAIAGAYADGGLAGVNRFRRDTGWTPHKPAIRFTNSAYGMMADAVAVLRGLQSSDRLIGQALSDAATLLSFALPRGFWDGHNRLQSDGGLPVFELLAEAVQELSTVAASRDPLATEARRVRDGLLRAGQSLAETALGDALIVGGSAREISHAQAALDRAQLNAQKAAWVQTIDDLNAAWSDSSAALRF